MPRGGRRVGAGRPPGVKNTATQKSNRRLSRANLSQIIGNPELDPLMQLIAIGSDLTLDVDRRITALSACLKHCYPVLSQAQVQSLNANVTVPTGEEAARQVLKRIEDVAKARNLQLPGITIDSTAAPLPLPEGRSTEAAQRAP